LSALQAAREKNGMFKTVNCDSKKKIDSLTFSQLAERPNP
jgi:hypothetical protein